MADLKKKSIIHCVRFEVAACGAEIRGLEKCALPLPRTTCAQCWIVYYKMQAQADQNNMVTR